MKSAHKPPQLRPKPLRCLLPCLISAFALVTPASVVNAQAPPFQWVREAGGLLADQAAAVTTDRAGDIYLTGSFQDRVTFGADAFGATDNGDLMFVSKLDSTGSFIWTRAASVSGAGPSFHAAGRSIALDSSGAVYAAGVFDGSVSFGATTLGSTPQGVCVVKYSNSGSVVWAKGFGGNWDNCCRAVNLVRAGIAVGPGDAVYVTGAFSGSSAFGTTTLTSAGDEDIFLVKLDANGNAVWVRKAGGLGFDSGTAITTDAAGNVYLAGWFERPSNFGGIGLNGHAQSSVVGYFWPSAFIGKYDVDGNVIWATQITSGNDVGRVNSLSTDAQGTSYVAGDVWQQTFSGSTLSGSNSRYLFAKINDLGTLVWQNQGGNGPPDTFTLNPPNSGNGSAIDASGNVLFAGHFTNSVSIGSTNLTSSGDWDLFLAELNPQGALVWAKQAGLVFKDSANGVSVDASGNTFLCGSFYDSTRFGSTNLSGNRNEIFLAMLPAIAPVPPTITAQPQSQTLLQGSNAMFAVAAAGTDPLAYQWKFNGSSLASATNSLLTITNVQATNEGSYRVIVSNLGGSVTSIVATLTIVYAPSITNQPQSQIVAAGTNVSFSVLAGGTPPLKYQWRFNGTNLVNAINPVLVVSNAQPANGGNYTIVITNNYGAMTSSIASLTVRYLLTVNITGTGTVTRNPMGDLYPPNFTVSLTPNPGAGYAFSVWSGDASGSANPLSLTMTSNKTVTANFSSTAVAISIQGQGSVGKAPDKPFYAVGEQVMLTATAARWFAFTRWGDGPTINPRMITIGPSNSYTAIFSPTTAVETVTFANVTRTAPVGMPIIFVDGEFIVTNELSRLGHAEIAIQTTFPNGTILFTVNGNAPNAFSSLYEGPFTISRSSTLRAVAYDADFASWWEADPIQIEIRPTYSVFATTAGGGTISISPTNQDFASDTVVTVTAAPNPGWSLLQWLGDAQGTNPAVTLLMDRDRCLEAVFGTTLRTTASGNGAIAIDPAASAYPYGWTVAVSALPAPGNSFAVWGDSGRGTNNPLPFIVTNANPNVSALFAASPAGQYSLAVRSFGRGHVITPRANRYNNGQIVTLTAVPDRSQQFLGWSGPLSTSQNPLSIAIDQDTILTATFTRKPELTIWNCGDRKAGDPLRVIFSGELGDRFAFEISPDLVDWMHVPDVTNEFGRAQFDFPSTNSGSGFIRARLRE